MEQSPEIETRPHCETCGMAWTTNAWRPKQPYSGSLCDCRGHQTPEANERQQHAIGKHNYRAWTTTQSSAAVKAARS